MYLVDDRAPGRDPAAVRLGPYVLGQHGRDRHDLHTARGVRQQDRPGRRLGQLTALVRDDGEGVRGRRAGLGSGQQRRGDGCRAIDPACALPGGGVHPGVAQGDTGLGGQHPHQVQIRVAELLAVALPRDGQRAEQLALHLDRHLQGASGGRLALGGEAVGDRTTEPVGVLVVQAEGGVARAGEGGGGLGETAQRAVQVVVGADRHHRLQELRKPGDRPAGQLAQALRGACGELSRRIRRLQGTPLTFGRFEQSNSPERVLLGCPRAGGPREVPGRRSAGRSPGQRGRSPRCRARTEPVGAGRPGGGLRGRGAPQRPFRRRRQRGRRHPGTHPRGQALGHLSRPRPQGATLRQPQALACAGTLRARSAGKP